ncbi:hypothetical protein [Cerasicoccus arenae]|uniref:Uncharacterized protein n=2 Tax=Cerasicoccus arenae TaxID=424488 RepID=A0A8J3DC84_9BACT|nr:hypothetical protein [Cerasicoccus arenae]MBK1859075.1 hypothetical protein [Cerasicoccus arenae]GHC03519.1 hypothetical protein GCM10007047_20150 [Cerasicoccus arenae]
MKIQKIACLFAYSLIGLCSLTFADNFRVVSLTQIPGLTSLEYVSEGKVITVPVSMSSFSQVHTIPTTRQLALYDKAPVPEEQKQPVLNLQFPKDPGDVIVLLKSARTANGLTYQYELLDDSSTAFPLGSVYICNYMQESVIIRLGAERILVESKQRSVVPLTKQEKPFNDGVAFAAEINGHGRVFSTSSWYLSPSMKIFCIIYKDDRGNPQIRRIRLT